jgi:gamma-F420-2:alpha-L-glutamate ligase
MEVWILFNEELESSTAEAYEVRRFMTEGKKMGIDVKVFNPEQFDLIVTDEDRDYVLIDGQQQKLPDFILPRTYVIDTGYFALAVIRQLERMGVKVYNVASTIEMVADKLHTHQVLAENKLPTPDTMLAKFPVDIDLVEKSLGFPVVVKTLMGVNGSGVFLIENRDGFEDLMDLIRETQPNILMIFQKFIAHSKGRDIRLFVVNGRVVASMERRAKEGGFKANFSQGGSVHEFVPDEEAELLAIRTADILDIQVAGIDLLFTDEGYTICEANTFPGFKGLEKACDVNIPYEIFSDMMRDMGMRPSHPDYDDHGRKISDMLNEGDDDSVLNKTSA